MANIKSTDDKNPNELIAKLQKNSLTQPLLISIVLHAVMIGVFSISFISLCIKYNTLDPKAAIAAEKEQTEQRELEAKRKKMADEAAAEDKKAASTVAKPDATKTTEKTTEKVPQVIKDTTEVINEKPEGPSSLDSFKDDF